MSDTTLPAETAIGRVALEATDMATVADFYAGVIGLDVHSRSSERVVLGPAGDEPILEIHESDDSERPTAAAGLFHHAIRVPDRAALGGVLHRIEADWTLDGASDHGVSEALYLQDPEGNGVEVYRDRPREAWPRDDDGAISMYTQRLDLQPLREAADTTNPLVDATMGHVHLEVTDLAASRDFYVDTLGLDVADTWGRRDSLEALFVAAGGYHHHVGLNTWGGRTAPASGRGLTWFELRVPDRETVGAVRDRLQRVGAPVADVEAGLASEDPDGIEVRVVTRPDSTSLSE